MSLLEENKLTKTIGCRPYSNINLMVNTTLWRDIKLSVRCKILACKHRVILPDQGALILPYSTIVRELCDYTIKWLVGWKNLVVKVHITPIRKLYFSYGLKHEESKYSIKIGIRIFFQP